MKTKTRHAEGCCPTGERDVCMCNDFEAQEGVRQLSLLGKWLPCRKGHVDTDHGQGRKQAPGENHGEPECEFSSTPHTRP